MRRTSATCLAFTRASLHRRLVPHTSLDQSRTNCLMVDRTLSMSNCSGVAVAAAFVVCVCENWISLSNQKCFPSRHSRRPFENNVYTKRRRLAAAHDLRATTLFRLSCLSTGTFWSHPFDLYPCVHIHEGRRWQISGEARTCLR